MFIKKILLIYSILCICIFSSAQSINSNHEIQLFIKKAHQYRIGLNVEQDYNKSFEFFEKASRLGSAEATHALGMMYQKGFGCEMNINMAIKFYTLASNQRYAQSHYNLGLIYKFGNGVDIDFVRAYEHFSQCAQLGSCNGMYGIGYMLFRGHGCVQNYSEAYSWFIKGAAEKHPSCMYYAGLCLRNGYGVEKDTAYAKILLTKAAEEGYSLAKCELSTHEAENNNTSFDSGLKSTLFGASAPQTFRKIVKTGHAIDISGIWIGTRTTYDYSGQHIITKQPIEVQLFQNEDKIAGTWIEDDTLNIAMEGSLNNNQLLFEKGQGLRTNRYNRQYLCNIEQGTFKIEHKENEILLTGNISEVDTFYREPRQPVYISLRRIKKHNGIEENMEKEQQLRLFPNPFSLQTTLEYAVPSDGKVHIELYNMQGKSMEVIQNSIMQKGIYRIELGKELTPGTYIIKMMFEGKQLYKNLLIIKKP